MSRSVSSRLNRTITSGASDPSPPLSGSFVPSSRPSNAGCSGIGASIWRDCKRQNSANAPSNTSMSSGRRTSVARPAQYTDDGSVMPTSPRAWTNVIARVQRHVEPAAPEEPDERDCDTVEPAVRGEVR